MEIIELTKEQLIQFLFNQQPIHHGQFGILTLIDDKIYKIHYKTLIDTYMSKDETKLDYEVKTLLEIDSILNIKSHDIYEISQNFDRLKNTKSNNLISGILTYKGIYVGVQMNYYKQYIKLSDAVQKLDENSIFSCLKHTLELIHDLLMNNIVPKDIKEDNILVNPDTLNIIIIDLDGYETIYGPQNYVSDYPYTKRIVIDNFEKMKNRILKKRM